MRWNMATQEAEANCTRIRAKLITAQARMIPLERISARIWCFVRTDGVQSKTRGEIFTNKNKFNKKKK